MNCGNFADTKAQQAPDQPAGSAPPWSTVRQAVRSAPVHCALKIAQPRICGSAQATNSSARTVSTESTGVAKRFLRTQAPSPASERGAASASAISVRTQDMSCSSMGHLSFSAILALNQFMNSEVSRLMLR